jgi:hypothetical protein
MREESLDGCRKQRGRRLADYEDLRLKGMAGEWFTLSKLRTGDPGGAEHELEGR